MTTEREAAPPHRRGALHRAARVATVVEMGLAGAAVTLIFATVLLQAVQRYLPIDGWAWTGELARFSLVWLTFVAAGVLLTRDGHIALKIADAVPSAVVLRGVHAFALLAVAATALLFARECWTLITETGNLRSPAMRMPMAWHYVLPLVGFLSTAVRGVIAAGVVVRHGVPSAAGTTEGGRV